MHLQSRCLEQFFRVKNKEATEGKREESRSLSQRESYYTRKLLPHFQTESEILQPHPKEHIRISLRNDDSKAECLLVIQTLFQS
jgi:hypothetical protein